MINAAVSLLSTPLTTVLTFSLILFQIASRLLSQSLLPQSTTVSLWTIKNRSKSDSKVTLCLYTPERAQK